MLRKITRNCYPIDGRRNLHSWVLLGGRCSRILCISLRVHCLYPSAHAAQQLKHAKGRHVSRDFATTFSNDAAFNFKYFMDISPKPPRGKKEEKKRKKHPKQLKRNTNTHTTHHVLIIFLKSFPGGAEETSCERQTGYSSVCSQPVEIGENHKFLRGDVKKSIIETHRLGESSANELPK